jgi:hypothetical protein
MTRWWLRLSARDRRALALGAWIAVPALLVALVLRPALAQLSDLRDTLAAERLLLARERAALAEARAQRLDTERERPVAERLFSGRDDVIATAALASYVGDLAEAQDVWVQSATTLDADRDASGVRQLRVSMRAEGDVTGVVRLLDALERGRFLVRVDNLEIAVTPAERSGDGSEPLVVRATLTGFAAPTREDAP